MEEIREQLLRKIPNNVDGSIYISYEESEKSQREIEKLKNEKWVDYIKSFGKGKIEVFVLNQYLNNEKFEQDKTEVIKKITKKIENGYKEDEIFDLDIGVMGNYRIEICNYLVNADYIASYELVGNSKISCKINRKKFEME
jgi:hypothetical protein